MPKPFICPKCGDDLELSPRCQCGKESMMSEYKPDWSSIPKEFKYCYYFTHASTDDGRQLILSVNHIPRYDNSEYMKRADRPPELVDGAWYAVTTKVEAQLVCRFLDRHFWRGDSIFKPDELTVHNRIPDELWNG